MAEAVFILCGLTSLACCVLLLRAYRRTRTRLLLWSGVCFAGLTINNALVFVDIVLVPAEISLFALRSATTLASLLVLIVGLVAETNRSGS